MKRLATTRLTRLTALRGLAAGGVAALSGMRRTADEAEARHTRKKRKVCHCTDASAASCRTLIKARKKVRKHLQRHPCDYKGRCKGFSGCAPVAPCQNNNQCTGGQVCSNGQCVDCTGDAQCTGGQDLCQRALSAAGEQCQNNNQCTAGQVCVGGECVDCTSYTQCPGQTCRGGVCFGGGPCANSTQCVAPTTCEDPPATGSDRFCLYGNICSTNADCGCFPRPPSVCSDLHIRVCFGRRRLPGGSVLPGGGLPADVGPRPFTNPPGRALSTV